MKRQTAFQTLGIRARVLLLALLPVGVAVTLLGYNLASSRLDDAEQSLAERGSLIARNLALASEFALFSQNTPLLSDTLRRIAGEADVRWSAVWDRQRHALVSSGEGPDESQTKAIVEALAANRDLPLGYYHAPIRVELADIADFPEEYERNATDTRPAYPAQLLGYAVIAADRSGIDARRSAIVRNTSLITLAGLAGSILLALFTGNSITAPVMRLLGTVHELQSGNLSARIDVRAGGEIGHLEHGINQMAETLEQSQQTLRLRIEEATQALRDTVDELEVRNLELEQAREVALLAGQERTEFLARMSHEIRTPLNAVVGFTRLLQTDTASPANEEHIGTIQRAAEQLLHVINDILQFIRLDAGADQLEHLQFNIADVLEDAVAMLVPIAEEKGLELILLLHGDLPETAWGDPSRLSQVLVNLLNNAIKFTSQGQVMIEAEHGLDRNDNGRVVISVKDTGIGLDPEQQSRVFDAFTQSDSSITRRFGGTGLGLSIARRLIELMGGEIGVESSKGQGSRFWIDLPCIDCSAPASVEGTGPLAGKRMLIYDANPFVRRSLRSVMTAWGIQVFNTGDWERALGLLRQHKGHEGFSALIIGLAPAEQRAAQVERYVLGLRRDHSGLVVLLTGSEKWTPPDSVSAMPPLDSATKPIRRRTLRRLLFDHLAGPRRHVEGPADMTREHRLPGMQVLVAEDNALNRSLLRHLLEQQGAMVDEAVTGKAAVSAAEHGGYDVILMDLHMPELDGAEAASRIRTALGEKSPPILALTADVFGRSEIAGAEDCFDDWLLKPIDPLVLVGRLAGLHPQGTRHIQHPIAAQTGSPRIPVDLQRRYADEIRRLLGEIYSATQSGDRSLLQDTLHNLKGIIGLLGYPELQPLVEQLDADLFEVGSEVPIGQLTQFEERIRRALQDALPNVD